MSVNGRSTERSSEETERFPKRTADTDPSAIGPSRAEADLTRWLTDNHHLFREMLDGCVVVSPEGRLLEANPAYCRMVGYPREVLCEMVVADVEAIHTPEEIASQITKVLAGTKGRFETQHRTVDGGLIDLEVLTHVVSDSQAQPHAIFCIFRDINEQKRLEMDLENRVRERTRSLREANQDLRQEIAHRRRAEAAIECQRDIALLLAQATSIEPGLRASAERLFQTPGIDAVGIYLLDKNEGVTLVTHAGLTDDFAKKVQYFASNSPNAALVREGEPWSHTLIQSCHGPVENLDLIAQGFRSVASFPLRHIGGVIGCVNVGSRQHDEFPDTLRHFLETIASQIGSAVARLTTEELLRLKDRAIDSSFSAIAITDAEERVSYVNHACLELWGFQHESQVLGRPVGDLWANSPDVIGVSDLIRDTGGWSGEIVARRPNGSTFETQVAISAITDESGNLVATMGSILDITHQKEAERALLRAEKLRVEAEKCIATGRMAARVAHEINNPLAGIANCFQLVKRAIPESHRYHRFVPTIEREIGRIGRIVRQMYELSRPTQSAEQSVCFDEALTDVITVLTPTARQDKIRFESDLEPHLPLLAITGDALRQVIYNLLTNAIEASPPGEPIRLRAWRNDGTVWLTVSDNGFGIREEFRSRIFEPFFSTKDDSKSGGLGLGLPISKSIVESMGGTIDFLDSKTGGTTFRVGFPIKREENSTPQSKTLHKNASPRTRKA